MPSGPDPTQDIRDQGLRGRPGCRIARSDRWQVDQWPGRKWWFVISDFGNGYYVMRLFATAKSRDFWMIRCRRWGTGRVQSVGTIRWKV